MAPDLGEGRHQGIVAFAVPSADGHPAGIGVELKMKEHQT
jgi:hypothetical protein